MNGEEQYELEMPFVDVVSQGGPYEDAAYTAGWEMGQLDKDLYLLAFIDGDSLTRTIHLASKAQADLIGMKHGFYLTLTDPEDEEVAKEWVHAEFTKQRP